MTHRDGTTAGVGLDRLDRVLLLALLGLGAGTLLMVGAPALPERIVAPALDLALDSFALVITSIVATLAWIRFRERRQPIALYQATAFLVLAITYLRAVIDTVGIDPTAPLASGEPGQEQLVVFTVGRLMAAVLLVLGGVSALRERPEDHPRRIVAVSAAMIVFVALVAHPAAMGLPALIVSTDAGPALTTIGAALHLVGAAGFVAAVIVCRRLWRRDRSVADSFVAVGLLFAAFALVVGSITPGTHPGPVTVADGLWFAFDIALLLAIEAEARSLLGALRQANSTLADLHEAELARAAFEERARLSRELHDGLTQDLWLAKLKIGRLAGMTRVDSEASALVEEASQAIDQGLSEAHQAVMAMRMAAAVDGAFGQLLVRYTEDFEDRFGQRVLVEAGPDLPILPARTQAELLRIAQEALANVHRHAQARTVRVRVGREGDRIRLTIADDGRGFAAHDPAPTDFGLLAMRERASLIGGELRVTSAPGEGTIVDVSAPIEHHAHAGEDREMNGGLDASLTATHRGVRA